MCVPDVLLTATFLTVKEMHNLVCARCLGDIYFLAVKKMHDLDACAGCQDCFVFQNLHRPAKRSANFVKQQPGRDVESGRETDVFPTGIPSFCRILVHPD